MKINVYESALLINAALEDEQIESVIARVKEVITNNGGEIREIENWGRKRLAYVVKKSKIGYYAIFRFNASSSIVSKLERLYTFDEHILRFLTILLDNDAVEHLEKNKAASISAETEVNPKEEVHSEAVESEAVSTKEIE